MDFLKKEALMKHVLRVTLLLLLLGFVMPLAAQEKTLTIGVDQAAFTLGDQLTQLGIVIVRVVTVA